MSYIQVTSNNIQHNLVCPTSKSYANRALIVAALKNEKVLLKQIPDAKDVEDLCQLLTNIGVRIDQREKDLCIENSFPECETISDEIIDIGGSEGGTTIRFLLPLLALGRNKYRIQMKGRLKNRPMNELFELLRGLGALVEVENELLVIQGPIELNGKKITIDCTKTTQFASAFLLLKGSYQFEVSFQGLKSSIAYIEMTKKVLDCLRESNIYSIPVDFSSLGYLVCYGILRQDLLISNVFEKDFYQADSCLFDILDKINANYEFTKKGLSILKSKLDDGFKVDARDCIDLVPTLFFLASFIPNTSKFLNVSYLKDKESDRLKEMMQIMKNFQVDYHYNTSDDELVIKGKHLSDYPLELQKSINTAEDHRMVMVSALYLKLLGGGEVTPFHCISKSFPEFFTIFK